MLSLASNILGRSDSVKGKPEILAKELAKDEDTSDSDVDGYVETVVRTEKRKVVHSSWARLIFKVRGATKKDKASAIQIFNVEIADEGVQATPSMQTASTQTLYPWT